MLFWILAALVGVLLTAALLIELVNPPSDRRFRVSDTLFLTALAIAFLILPWSAP